MTVLRNYLINGEGQIRGVATSAVLTALANAGIGVGTAPNPLGPDGEIISLTSIPASGLPEGAKTFIPGWGGGPGGGGNYSFQLLDRDFHDLRFPGNPERYLWLGWNTHPNGTDYIQNSGWEPGSTHCDQSEWNPWRITFIEQGLKRAEKLLGSWVGYSLHAMAGSGIGGPTFPVRPYLITNYANGDFFMRGLQSEVTLQPDVVTEICGWFYLSNIPVGKTVVRSEFGIGFGLDTTYKTPPPIVMTSFKLGRWPYQTTPDVPASEIKYLIEDESPALMRVRAKNWSIET